MSDQTTHVHTPLGMLLADSPQERELERLRLENAALRVLCKDIIDVYNVVLPYRILQKGRKLLGRS